MVLQLPDGRYSSPNLFKIRVMIVLPTHDVERYSAGENCNIWQCMRMPSSPCLVGFVLGAISGSVWHQVGYGYLLDRRHTPDRPAIGQWHWDGALMEHVMGDQMFKLNHGLDILNTHTEIEMTLNNRRYG